MSLLDKIMFWKKKDNDMPDFELPDFGKGDSAPGGPGAPPDLDLPKFGNDAPGTGRPPSPEMPPSGASSPGFEEPQMPEMPPTQPSAPQQDFSQPQMQQPSAPAQPALNNRDIQLISSKLDTLKAQMDSLNHKIERIEKIAESSQGDDKQVRW